MTWQKRHDSSINLVVSHKKRILNPHKCEPNDAHFRSIFSMHMFINIIYACVYARNEHELEKKNFFAVFALERTHFKHQPTHSQQELFFVKFQHKEEEVN